jgi:hypothetical protein
VHFDIVFGFRIQAVELHVHSRVLKRRNKFYKIIFQEESNILYVTIFFQKEKYVQKTQIDTKEHNT